MSVEGVIGRIGRGGRGGEMRRARGGIITAGAGFVW